MSETQVMFLVFVLFLTLIKIHSVLKCFILGEVHILLIIKITVRSDIQITTISHPVKYLFIPKIQYPVAKVSAVAGITHRPMKTHALNKRQNCKMKLKCFFKMLMIIKAPRSLNLNNLDLFLAWELWCPLHHFLCKTALEHSSEESQDCL